MIYDIGNIIFPFVRNFLIIRCIVNGREERCEEIYHPTNSLSHNMQNMMESDNDTHSRVQILFFI